MTVRKQIYLTETEFALCASAAGLEKVPCFESGLKKPLTADMINAVVWTMTRDGLLTAEEDGSFTLDKDLSRYFKIIAGCEQYCELYRGTEEPYCIVYRKDDGILSLQPGRWRGDYVGFAEYSTEELTTWLCDMHLTPEKPHYIPPNAALIAFMDGGAEGDAPGILKGRIDCKNIATMELEDRLYIIEDENGGSLSAKLSEDGSCCWDAVPFGVRRLFGI